MQKSRKWSDICKPHEWRAMRSIAYANNGLVHEPARQHKPLILLIDGQWLERRNTSSSKELLAKLREKYPDAEVLYERISKLSVE